MEIWEIMVLVGIVGVIGLIIISIIVSNIKFKKNYKVYREAEKRIIGEIFSEGIAGMGKLVDVKVHNTTASQAYLEFTLEILLETGEAITTPMRREHHSMNYLDLFKEGAELPLKVHPTYRTFTLFDYDLQKSEAPEFAVTGLSMFWWQKNLQSKE